MNEKTSTGKTKKLAFTKEQKDEFCIALIECKFNINAACTKVGIDRSSYYYALKWDKDFADKISWSENFIGNIVTNGILEGIVTDDLNLRHKYIQLIVQAGLLEKFLLTNKTQNTEINSEDIILE